MSQANIEIVKNCYAAFGRGDIPTILASLAEDVDWSNPGEGLPTCGHRRGVAEVTQFFQTVGETWNFTAFEPREYIASNDAVVAIGSYSATAKATGKSVTTDWVMVWKFSGGKIAYFKEYTDTLALAAAVKA